jgi:hypothetical protein
LKCELTDENAFPALETVNKVIAENKDLEKPQFIRAHLTLSINLTLPAGLDNCALDYETCLKVITESLIFVGEGTAIVNEKWSKFLLHGVPTFGALEEIRNDVEIYYPKLKLGQTPQWLAPADKGPENLPQRLFSLLLAQLPRKIWTVPLTKYATYRHTTPKALKPNDTGPPVRACYI